MDTYCWIQSTFTLMKLVNAEVGQTVSNPGVGPFTNEDEVVKHKYYQWVCFTLFLQVIPAISQHFDQESQGCCFVVPYSLWKNWEKGILASLIPQDDLMHKIHDARMPGWVSRAVTMSTCSSSNSD